MKQEELRIPLDSLCQAVAGALAALGVCLAIRTTNGVPCMAGWGAKASPPPTRSRISRAGKLGPS